MDRRRYTREILQAEADRFRPEADRQHELLKAQGTKSLLSLGFIVYTDAALHDAAIKAPPGFSAGYIAVGARSRSGRATVYVELAASDYAPNPYDLMYWQLRNHIYTPTEDLAPYLEALRILGTPSTARHVADEFNCAQGLAVTSDAAKRRLDRLVESGQAKPSRAASVGRPYLYEVADSPLN